MGTVFRILLYTSLVPLVAGLFRLPKLSGGAKLVLIYPAYELVRQLLLEHVIPSPNVWTTHLDAVIPISVLIMALTPKELPYGIVRKNLILFLIILITGITLIDWLTHPDPTRISVYPNTVSAIIISLVSFINMRYLSQSIRVQTKDSQMFIISRGVLVYYLASIFFFSQISNIWEWSSEALLAFMVVNKAFFAIVLMGSFTIAFMKND